MSQPHNPANLTAEQIGTGFRLLDADEIKPSRRKSSDIERWDNGKWFGYCGGISNWITYRTRLSREQLKELP